MFNYRICLFDEHGYNRRSFYVDCAGDAEACTVGKGHLGRAALVQVWKRDRLLGEFAGPFAAPTGSRKQRQDARALFSRVNSTHQNSALIGWLKRRT